MDGRNRLYIGALLCLFALVHLALFWRFGIRTLYDSNLYIESADFLIANGSLPKDYHYFYIVPISLLAMSRWLFSGEVIPYLIFQCLVSVAAMISLYVTSCRLFKSTLAGVLSGILFLIWWENVQWNTTVLTESLFCSFVCFVLYAITGFNGRTRDYVTVVIVLTILMATRPTGIVIALGVVVYMLHRHRRLIAGSRALKFSIATGLLIIFATGAYLMFSIWDFTDQYRRGNIVTYIDVVQGTPLYSDDLREDSANLVLTSDDGGHALKKMSRFVIDNPTHFLRTAVAKIGYLLSGYRPYYSDRHNAYLLVWVSLMYLFAVVGMRAMTDRAVLLMIVITCVVNCLLIGISTVDWDNRFYIPMFPPLVVAAGGGAAHLIRKGFGGAVEGNKKSLQIE